MKEMIKHIFDDLYLLRNILDGDRYAGLDGYAESTNLNEYM